MLYYDSMVTMEFITFCLFSQSQNLKCLLCVSVLNETLLGIFLNEHNSRHVMRRQLDEIEVPLQADQQMPPQRESPMYHEALVQEMVYAYVQ